MSDGQDILKKHVEFNEKALTEKGREREYIQRLIEKACRKTFTRSRNQKSLTCLERKPLHDQESVKLTKSRKKAFEGGYGQHSPYKFQLVNIFFSITLSGVRAGDAVKALKAQPHHFLNFLIRKVVLIKKSVWSASAL